MTADDSSAERTRLHPARLPRARFHRARGQHRDPSRTALARWGRGRGPAAVTGPETGTGVRTGTDAGGGTGTATRAALLTVALPSAATLGVFAAAAAAVPTRTAPRPQLPPAPTGVPGIPSRAPAVGSGPTAVATTTVAGATVGSTTRAGSITLAGATAPIGGGSTAPGRSGVGAPADRGRERPALTAHREPSPREQRSEERSAPAPGAREQNAREQSVLDTARPRYCLPVAARGLGAGYGRAGAHWAARHTGIDFPVAAGTAVHAVTDGTVATGWTPAFGYLAIVRAPDGTETWYAHLRGYRVHPGPVRAGDVIATSGATGNATGPHLHVEVRPGGGPPVDPLPWLLAHGLDPR